MPAELPLLAHHSAKRMVLFVHCELCQARLLCCLSCFSQLLVPLLLSSMLA